jgi:hypothetical protein
VRLIASGSGVSLRRLRPVHLNDSCLLEVRMRAPALLSAFLVAAWPASAGAQEDVGLDEVLKFQQSYAGSRLPSTARITIANGPHAGSYTLESKGQGLGWDEPCSMPDEKPGSFRGMFQSGDPRYHRKPKEVAMMQLKAESARPGSASDQVMVVVTFGDPRKGGAEYVVNTITGAAAEPDGPGASGEAQAITLPGRQTATGRGTATLERRDSTAALRFDTETARGVKLQVAVECPQVATKF